MYRERGNLGFGVNFVLDRTLAERVSGWVQFPALKETQEAYLEFCKETGFMSSPEDSFSQERQIRRNTSLQGMELRCLKG